MDPDANLEYLRTNARVVVASDGSTFSSQDGETWEGFAKDLAEYVLALDEWITKGGFLPQAWNEYRLPAGTRAQGIAFANMLRLNDSVATVRANKPDAFMMAGYWLVTFADGFECGIAPDGSVSS